MVNAGLAQQRGRTMSAITSRKTDIETTGGIGLGWLAAASLTLAPLALIAFGLARGGLEPYLVLAAWLLG